MGTLQYMAPEQLEGKEVDARTDIFAFGAVVYEMATGKRAFEGKSQASVIAKILETDPPPISSLQPMTPPALDRVVKRCLAKEPEKRWQTASDLCEELKWIAEGGSQAAVPAADQLQRSAVLTRRPLSLGLGALAARSVIAGLAVWNLKPTPANATACHPHCDNAAAGRPAGADQPSVALSPDGNHLAYVAIRGGTQQLYLRAMDSMEVRSIPGTEEP